MSEITLEKIDIVRERTGVSYSEAKEALEACEANVVDTLIYIEQAQKSEKSQVYATKEEFICWVKELIRKGNVSNGLDIVKQLLTKYPESDDLKNMLYSIEKQEFIVKKYYKKVIVIHACNITNSCAIRTKAS